MDSITLANLDEEYKQINIGLKTQSENVVDLFIQNNPI